MQTATKLQVLLVGPSVSGSQESFPSDVITMPVLQWEKWFRGEGRTGQEGFPEDCYRVE